MRNQARQQNGSTQLFLSRCRSTVVCLLLIAVVRCGTCGNCDALLLDAARRCASCSAPPLRGAYQVWSPLTYPFLIAFLLWSNCVPNISEINRQSGAEL